MTAPETVDAAPASPVASGPVGGRHVNIGGRAVPVILPKLGDPRLKLSAIILTLTVFGLTILDFKLSIPQILVSMLLAGLIEVAVTYRREAILVWPASALQTGLSIAFIFRVAGTRAHDLWSTNGLHLFAFVVVISLLSKYLLRHDGRHIFNPSNVGLAWGLLLIGPSHVFSEHLWWAPLGLPITLSMVVIVGGAWLLLRQVRMIKLATAFLVPFLAMVAVLALAGKEYVAIWHEGPVTGAFYWVTIALSPELLIFVFFMITDPQTAPKSHTGRMLYAVTTAVLCAGLIALQTTEFGIKLSILAPLVLTCALTPWFDRLGKRIEAGEVRQLSQALPSLAGLTTGLATLRRNPVLAATAVIAVAAVVNTALLTTDGTIELIERGLTSRLVQ